LRLFFVSRVHPASFITLRSFYNILYILWVTFEFRLKSHGRFAGAFLYICCRKPLPVLQGAWQPSCFGWRILCCTKRRSLCTSRAHHLAQSVGDPFHQFSNRFGILERSSPVWLALFLVGFASGFDVGVIVFSLSLGIYRVSDFLSLCLQSMWDYASFYSSSFCLFCFNSFPVLFVQCFMFSLCSIQCHEFQQCIWRRTLCWQSEWPRSTPSLFSSIPYSFAIAKDNVSPMKQSRQGVDLEKDFFFLSRADWLFAAQRM